MGGGGGLVVSGCEVEAVGVEVDGVEVDVIRVVDFGVVVVEIVGGRVDVVNVVDGDAGICSCGTPAIWERRDCTWLVGVVATGFVVGSSASWVMWASGEQATPRSEQASAKLLRNSVVVFEKLAAARIRVRMNGRGFRRKWYVLTLWLM